MEFVFKRSWALGSNELCLSEGKVSGLCLGLLVTGQLTLSQLTNILCTFKDCTSRCSLHNQCSVVISDRLVNGRFPNFIQKSKRVKQSSECLLPFRSFVLFHFEIFSSFRFWLLSEWMHFQCLWAYIELNRCEIFSMNPNRNVFTCIHLIYILFGSPIMNFEIIYY